MKIVKKPKKKRGEYRTIYCPSKKEKQKFRDILSDLENCFFAQEKKILGETKNIIIHGFVPNRSIITNAECHCGFDYTINFDLQDFFDTVSPQNVKDLLPQDIINQCFIDLAPRQGLPTSPLIANIAALKLDRAILRFIGKRNLDVVYTRYADDLSFSYTEQTNKDFISKNDQEKSLHEFLIRNIPNIISKNGFKSNKRKIHFQSSKFGRRNITGIKVDEKIHPSREIKRKIRAAHHQKNESSLVGLQEFAKLKKPSPKSKKKEFSRWDIISFLFYKKKNIDLKEIINEKSIDIGENYQKIYDYNGSKFIFTNDIIYKYAMSSLGDGWKSCYSVGGSNRNAPVIMSFIKGVYICGELSEKTKKFGKLTRNLLKSRTIVYQLDNGEYCYNKSMYGNNQQNLRNFLEEKLGIKSNSNCSGSGVIGYGPIIKNNAIFYGGIKSKKLTVKANKKTQNFLKLYV